MKIKKGDTIIITVGKDKGKQGKVEKVNAAEHTVMVPGVNTYKRHMKKRDEKNPGGIIDMLRAIDVGKTALVCPACGKPTRVGYVFVKDEKVRICRKCKKKI